MTITQLSLGKVEAGVASLMTLDGLQSFEVPCKLLPMEVLNRPGSIISLTTEHSKEHETAISNKIHSINQQISTLYRDTTSTLSKLIEESNFLKSPRRYHDAIVVEWESIATIGVELYGIDLICNERRMVGAMQIGLEEMRAAVSGLSPDTAYTFRLSVRTTNGVLESKELVVKTRALDDFSYRVSVGTNGNPELINDPFVLSNLTECDYLLTDDINSEEAKAARSLHIRTITNEWIESSLAKRGEK